MCGSALITGWRKIYGGKGYKTRYIYMYVTAVGIVSLCGFDSGSAGRKIEEGYIMGTPVICGVV